MLTDHRWAENPGNDAMCVDADPMASLNASIDGFYWRQGGYRKPVERSKWRHKMCMLCLVGPKTVEVYHWVMAS